MNIFILDEDQEKAAQYHCDKHVVKMILESSQMLSTAHWLLLLKNEGKSLDDFKRVRDIQSWLYKNTRRVKQPPYKFTHHRHPCTIWTANTLENYQWHLKLFKHLCKEYTIRYKRIHKSSYHLSWFYKNNPVGLQSSQLEKFPICMDDDYKISDDPVECYRNYYVKAKSKFAKWKYTEVPKWYEEKIN